MHWKLNSGLKPQNIHFIELILNSFTGKNTPITQNLPFVFLIFRKFDKILKSEFYPVFQRSHFEKRMNSENLFEDTAPPLGLQGNKLSNSPFLLY